MVGFSNWTYSSFVACKNFFLLELKSKTYQKLSIVSTNLFTLNNSHKGNRFLVVFNGELVLFAFCLVFWISNFDGLWFWSFDLDKLNKFASVNGYAGDILIITKGVLHIFYVGVLRQYLKTLNCLRRHRFYLSFIDKIVNRKTKNMLLVECEVDAFDAVVFFNWKRWGIVELAIISLAVGKPFVDLSIIE